MYFSSACGTCEYISSVAIVSFGTSGVRLGRHSRPGNELQNTLRLHTDFASLSFAQQIFQDKMTEWLSECMFCIVVWLSGSRKLESARSHTHYGHT